MISGSYYEKAREIADNYFRNINDDSSTLNRAEKNGIS
jgi:hypothetical protein